MPDFIDPQTRKTVTVDDPDDAASLYLAGHVAIPHADVLLPMSDPDGKPVGVRGKNVQAMLEAGGRFLSPTEHRKISLEQQYGGVTGAVKAGGAALARGITGGGTDWLAREASPETAAQLHELREAWPKLSAVTAGVGAAIPLIGQEVATEGAASPLIPEQLAALGLRGAEAERAAQAVAAARTAAEAGPAAEEAVQGTRLGAEGLGGTMPNVPPEPFPAQNMYGQNVPGGGGPAGWPAGTGPWAAPGAPPVPGVPPVAPPPPSPVGTVATMRQALGYTPPALISRLGRAVEEMIGGRALSPDVAKLAAEGAFGSEAAARAASGARVGGLGLSPGVSRIAKLAASGALEGGIYSLADQLDEQALGDPDATAEKAYAAFGHGMLVGSVLGIGIGGAAAGVGSILEKMSPTFRDAAAIAAFDQMRVEGGNTRRIVRSATRRFGRDAPKVVGRALLDEGIDLAQPLESLEKPVDDAAHKWGNTVESFAQAADNAGAPGIHAESVISDIRNSRAAQDLLETPGLNRHVGVDEMPAQVSPDQQRYMEDVAAKRPQRLPLAGPELEDLRARGLVQDNVQLSGLGNAALREYSVNREVAAAVNDVLTPGQRDFLRKLSHYEQVLPELPKSELDDLVQRGLVRERYYNTPAATLATKLRLTNVDLAAMDQIRLKGGRVWLDQRPGGMNEVDFAQHFIDKNELLRGLAKRGLVRFDGERLTSLGETALTSGAKMLLKPEEHAALTALRETGQAFVPGAAAPTMERLVDREIVKRAYRPTNLGRAIAPRPQLGDRLHLNEEELAALRLMKEQGTDAAVRHMPETVQQLIEKKMLLRREALTPDGNAVLRYRARTTLGEVIDKIRNVTRTDGTISLMEARRLRMQLDRIAKYDTTSRQIPAAAQVYRSAREGIERAIEEQILKTSGREALANYIGAKDKYGALDVARQLLNESLIAKQSKLRFGLKEMGMATLGGLVGLHGGPLGAVAGIAAGAASKYARRRMPGYAAMTFNKLSRLGMLEKAAIKVDKTVDTAAKDWFERVASGKKPTRAVLRMTAPKEQDHVERAKETIAQLHALRAAGPIDAAAVSHGLGDLAVHAPQTTGQLASKLNAVAQFIASKVPPDHADYSDITQPGTTHVSRLDYKSFDDAVQGATKPLEAFQSFARGTATQAQMQGAKAAVPKVFDQFQAAVLRQLAQDPVKAARIPFQAKMGMAFALGVPTNWALESSGVRFLQSDRSGVAKSPNTQMGGGNQMGKKTKLAHDLADNLATSTEKMESRLPGRKR